MPQVMRQAMNKSNGVFRMGEPVSAIQKDGVHTYPNKVMIMPRVQERVLRTGEYDDEVSGKLFVCRQGQDKMTVELDRARKKDECNKESVLLYTGIHSFPTFDCIGSLFFVCDDLSVLKESVKIVALGVVDVRTLTHSKDLIGLVDLSSMPDTVVVFSSVDDSFYRISQKYGRMVEVADSRLSQFVNSRMWSLADIVRYHVQ